MANSDIYVANESFTGTLDGESVTIKKGETRVRAGHKILKRWGVYFDPLTVQFDVEQATAAPGERRAAPAVQQKTEVKAAKEPEPVKEPEPAKAKPETAEPEKTDKK